jgi:hypothetical protein
MSKKYNDLVCENCGEYLDEESEDGLCEECREYFRSSGMERLY